MNISLTNGDSIEIASNWINNAELDFSAAFIGGSVAYADPKSPYDAASDVDCYLVIDGDPPDGKIGKITVDGVLLDVSWLPWSQLENAEQHAVIASLIRFGHIVTDNTGNLTSLQQRIASTFMDPDAIEKRLDDMRGRIRGIAVDNRDLPAPELVMNWLFPATLATHIPLIRAGAPLTVRKRLLAAKRVMDSGEYEHLLRLYGFADISRSQAQKWLDETAILLDATQAEARNSSRFWATDLLARDIAIDGSQRLIDEGFHREALYWIIATSARCLVVRTDAGVDSSAYLPAFSEMLRTMGIETREERAAKSAEILKWIED